MPDKNPTDGDKSEETNGGESIEETTTAETESQNEEEVVNTNSTTDENKSKEEEGPEEMDVLGNGKLLKKVLSTGDGRESRPQMGDQITVTFSAFLEDGTEVEKQDRLTFVLGDGDYLQAFDLCCALMDLDEKARITTDGSYAYGDLGRNPDIPPNAKMIFEVHLEKIHGPVDYISMIVSDRIAEADKKRERGNYYYSRTEYAGAINTYTKALGVLDDRGQSHSEKAEELQKIVDMRVKCYNNLAAAQLKIEVYDAAIKSCDCVLAVQPDNVKALFRKGKCLAARGEIKDAITSLKKALKYEPESKIIHNELSRLTNRVKVQEERERAMYQRMMGQEKTQVPEKKGWSIPGWALAAGSAGAAIFVSLGITAYKYYHHVP